MRLRQTIKTTKAMCAAHGRNTNMLWKDNIFRKYNAAGQHQVTLFSLLDRGYM